MIQILEQDLEHCDNTVSAPGQSYGSPKGRMTTLLPGGKGKG